MRYFTLGSDGPALSSVVLGGHEYLPDGRSRGFNEDFDRAVLPNSVMPGFGGADRIATLETALDLGINYFDVTIDSEKEALGRNLRDIAPSRDVFIQTRPEGMVYGYDPANVRLARYDELRAEVLRILALMGRERIDVLNFGILDTALSNDAAYLDKLAENIARLKREGLIGYAAADTFSGEKTFAAMLSAGCFDIANINFNIGETGAERNVIPQASAQGCRVVVRELLMKGQLFEIAKSLPQSRKSALAGGAIKWALSRPGVDGAIIGAANAEQLSRNVATALSPELSEAEQSAIAALQALPEFVAYQSRKTAEFYSESA
jgi:aryl-alcohol dehydrogenase-like predicted oxidoreductase